MKTVESFSRLDRLNPLRWLNVSAILTNGNEGLFVERNQETIIHTDPSMFISGLNGPGRN